MQMIFFCFHLMPCLGSSDLKEHLVKGGFPVIYPRGFTKLLLSSVISPVNTWHFANPHHHTASTILWLIKVISFENDSEDENVPFGQTQSWIMNLFYPQCRKTVLACFSTSLWPHSAFYCCSPTLIFIAVPLSVLIFPWEKNSLV